ncbi:MAG TPA: peptidoglycan DD-metalloendopeptidase family protein [Frankiaceae bacterium]|nr:peptidoglycan DD-metalloendopeptidase family protein [Frankiaceae bacterium]
MRITFHAPSQVARPPARAASRRRSGRAVVVVATLLLSAAPVLAPAPASATTTIQFPLIISKAEIQAAQPYTWCYWSQTNCHHDYNAADIMAPTGTQVVSPVDGVVERVVVDSDGVGSRVQIRDSSNYLWYLAHMHHSPAPVVTVGQSVSRGTPIGVVGTSAHAVGTQPHLHVDKLPPSYSSRPSCSGAECTGEQFINIQPDLVEAYGELDTTPPSSGTGVNSGADVYVSGAHHVMGIKTSTGDLYQNTLTSPPSGWTNLGGVVADTPAVTYHDGRYDVFARSPGGGMYQKTWNGTWGAWTSIGGTSLASGAAAVWTGSQYHVFAVNSSGDLMQRTWNGSWGAWQNLGGTVAGTPAVTYYNGRFDVFAHSPGGIMYQKTYNGSWGPWTSIGGSALTGGTGAVFAEGEFHVFGIDSAGDLMQRTWAGGSWGSWQNLGGTVSGTPAATYHDGIYDVFARSPGGIMYRKTWNGTWSGWVSVGGNFA